MKIDNKNGVVLYTYDEYLNTLSADEVRVCWHSVCRTLRALFIDRISFRRAFSTARKVPNYPAISLERIYLNLHLINEQIKDNRDFLFKIRRYAQRKRIKIK